MVSTKLHQITFCTLFFLHFCFASKMLLIMPIGMISHKIFFNGIVQALAQKGHKVTVISPFKPSELKPNVREITVSTNYVEQMIPNAFEASLMNLSKTSLKVGPKACVDTLLEEPVQRILKEKFDLILQSFFFAECYLPYIYENKIPFIFIVPNTLYSPCSEMVGNLEMPSIVPNIFTEATYPMTFMQRMVSSLISVTSVYSTYYGTNLMIEDECGRRGILSSNTPSISALQKTSSLAIINSVRALEIPQRLYSPTVIFAGGIHINPKVQLPKKLQQWLDASGDEGFILFSLGSKTKVSHMKTEHRQILVNVFQSLKQRILWKSDLQQINDLPPNVKLSQWLPQQAILAHPKIRLFITHGGLLSTQEATYFGVPIIGMPVFVDQHNNVARVTAEGWGKKLEWKHLTEETLRSLILETMEDSSLRQTVANRSTIMKDLPQSPSENVVYWVEYVLRYNGATHLQTPLLYMPWYQIYNTDVWIFLLLITTILSCIITYLLVILFRCCCFYRCCRNRKDMKTKKH